VSSLGFFLVLLGVVFIAAPQLIAYVIGTVLVLIGANILLVWFAARRATKQSGDGTFFRFGDYEISRRRK
jgi:multisubunit Na+/H+ antiporter MnhC subunit